MAGRPGNVLTASASGHVMDLYSSLKLEDPLRVTGAGDVLVCGL